MQSDEPSGSLRDRTRLYPYALDATVGITCAMDLLANSDAGELARDFRQLMAAPNDDGASIPIPGRQGLTYAVRSAHDHAYTGVEQ